MANTFPFAGDMLVCGDTIGASSLSSNVTINGQPAVLTGALATIGHNCGIPSHGPTPLYPDNATIGTRPNILINGVPPVLNGDWNVPAAGQVPPNFPDSTGIGCIVGCGGTCHDSQILITSSTNITAG